MISVPFSGLADYTACFWGDGGRSAECVFFSGASRGSSHTHTGALKPLGISEPLVAIPKAHESRNDRVWAPVPFPSARFSSVGRLKVHICFRNRLLRAELFLEFPRRSRPRRRCGCYCRVVVF